MQGFNKYYPPDYDGKSSANKLAGKNHSLGSRARKIKEGILIVRFACPYDIVCFGCNKTIAKGVRFNAAKKQDGDYLGIVIWSFGLKCPNCSNIITIRTNPKDTTYDIIDGAKKRVSDPDPEIVNNEVEPTAEQDDAFSKLEKKQVIQNAIDERNQEIKELYHKVTSQWDNPFAYNQKLRNSFRIKKKAIEVKETEKKKISDKLSLTIPLLDEKVEDVLSANAVVFKTGDLTKVTIPKNIFPKEETFNNRPNLISKSKYSQNALDDISSIVDGKNDVFAADMVLKSKKSVSKLKRTVTPSEIVTKKVLVDYSSDEE